MTNNSSSDTPNNLAKKCSDKILEQKFQDTQDLLSAKKTLQEAKESGEGFVSFNQVFKDVD